MATFIGSKTETNLRQAVATATLAYRRYMMMSEQADEAGDYRAAALFRRFAKSMAGQADENLANLESCDDAIKGK